MPESWESALLLGTMVAAYLLFAFLGATYMIGGVLDHLELRRLLPGIPDREMAPADGAASAAGSR